jgi:hypothetical protein
VVERLRADTRPIEAARLVVDASRAVPARTPILSALDESRMAAFVEALDGFGSALLAHAEALDAAREHIAEMRNFREDEPWDHPLVDLKDIRELLRRLGDDPRGAAVAGAGARLDRAASEAVVDAHGEGRSDAHGVSVYLPTVPLRIEKARKQYDTLLQQAPRWHEAVLRLSAPD